MGSTVRTQMRPGDQDLTSAATTRWRSWPLADSLRWSWLVPLAITGVAVVVWCLDGGWLLSFAAVAALAATLWQFLLPVTFEINSLGIRRRALGRTRLVPWNAVRAYQLRPTGIVLFQRPGPLAVDYLRSLFVPYPPDEDELQCATQQYLSHATELLRDA